MLPKAALGFFLFMRVNLIVKFLIFLALALFVSARPVRAYDERILKLSHFLNERNSILAPFAENFVVEADKNGLDYRLIPAIAGVESTFGRNHILGTYNVYGWGGGKIYFNSYEDGIAKLATGLKKGYLDKGAKTPLAISYIYCPPNHFSWYQKVDYFMTEIEKTDIKDALNAQKESLSTLAFTL